MPVSPSNKEGQGSVAHALCHIWEHGPKARDHHEIHWASHPKYERSHGSRTATADFAAQPLHSPATYQVGN
jgi:hypothetical protein